MQVFSGTDATVPTLSAGIAFWGPGSRTASRCASATTASATAWVIDASATNGWRDFSAAQRTQFNASGSARSTRPRPSAWWLKLLRPAAVRDPAGLTRADWRPTAPVAATVKAQDAGKVVNQQQIGSVYERRLSDATTLNARVYRRQPQPFNKLESR